MSFLATLAVIAIVLMGGLTASAATPPDSRPPREPGPEATPTAPAASPTSTAAAVTAKPRGAPKPMPAPRSAEDFLAAAKYVADRTVPIGYTGQYFKQYYPGLSDEGELRFAVTYTLWIPDGAKTLRGIIVHQHGAGMTASKEGSTAAYDLQWQALAKKWDCALLGPCYHVLNDGDWDAAGSIYWMDPRRGSEKTFLKALDDFAAKTGHAELSTVPWALWGHSAGGIWSDIMGTLHPDRVLAVYCRSGTQPVFMDRPLQVPPTTLSDAACGIPIMLSCGKKEDWITDKLLRTFRQYRAKGAPVGFAHDPRTEHECGDSRYFAIPFFDNCLAMRLPDKWSQGPDPQARGHEQGVAGAGRRRHGRSGGRLQGQARGSRLAAQRGRGQGVHGIRQDRRRRRHHAAAHAVQRGGQGQGRPGHGDHLERRGRPGERHRPVHHHARRQGTGQGARETGQVQVRAGRCSRP